ncbi:hypothetical protein HDU96_008494 [Phlyctochytrium bullatum]|nr:hypothetical protein HDU96_008494 [Phlyctochytrium bullatum]
MRTEKIRRRLNSKLRFSGGGGERQRPARASVPEASASARIRPVSAAIRSALSVLSIRGATFFSISSTRIFVARSHPVAFPLRPVTTRIASRTRPACDTALRIGAFTSSPHSEHPASVTDAQRISASNTRAFYATTQTMRDRPAAPKSLRIDTTPATLNNPPPLRPSRPVPARSHPPPNPQNAVQPHDDTPAAAAATRKPSKPVALTRRSRSVPDACAAALQPGVIVPETRQGKLGSWAAGIWRRDRAATRYSPPSDGAGASAVAPTADPHPRAPPRNVSLAPPPPPHFASPSVTPSAATSATSTLGASASEVEKPLPELPVAAEAPGRKSFGMWMRAEKGEVRTRSGRRWCWGRGGR